MDGGTLFLGCAAVTSSISAVPTAGPAAARAGEPKAHPAGRWPTLGANRLAMPAETPTRRLLGTDKGQRTDTEVRAMKGIAAVMIARGVERGGKGRGWTSKKMEKPGGSENPTPHIPTRL